MGTNVVEQEDVVLLSKLSGEVIIESKTEFFYPFPSYITYDVLFYVISYKWYIGCYLLK